MHVLVYGSLKQGLYNHIFMRGAKFMGNDTVKGYKLVDLGPYPTAVKIPDSIECKEPYIKGELYEIDEEILERLDGLEGYPNLYQRTVVKTDLQEEVYLYSATFPEMNEIARWTLTKLLNQAGQTEWRGKGG